MDFADGTFIIGVCLFYVGIAAVIRQNNSDYLEKACKYGQITG